MFALALALALLIGGSLGLLGGGGSILTLPILRYVLDMPAHEAIAVSLFVVGTTSLAALVPHARRGHVRWQTGALFGAAGMVGAFFAGRIAKYLPATLLLVGFGLMMLATGFAMLRRKRDGKPQAEPKPEGTRVRVGKVLLEGLAVGAVTGLVGAGGGFLVVPALVLLGRLPMKAAVGTSLLVIAMKSLAGFAGYWAHTSIDWPLALPIALAAVVGSIGGGALASKISPRTLQASFGWFVVAMAFFMLAQELPAVLGFTSSAPIALVIALVGTGALVLFAVSRRYTRLRKGRKSDHEMLGTNRVTAEAGGK